MIRCSFIPKNQPVVTFPLLAAALKTLCDFSPFMWQTLSNVESTNDIPVHTPRTEFKKQNIGKIIR